MSAVIRQLVSRRRMIDADADAFAARRDEIIAEARGEPGAKGDKGDKPKHEWKGSKLRFENPDGSWGKFVDLKGQPGKDGRTGFVSGSFASGGQNLSALAQGSESMAPSSMVVQQGGELVSLPWDAFIPMIAGAIDMSSTSSRRTDFVGESLLYRGEAAPGASENAAVWRIKRVEFMPDGDIAETWASGSADFIHVWAERATLSYS